VILSDAAIEHRLVVLSPFADPVGARAHAA
jgi:hypothetical protein